MTLEPLIGLLIGIAIGVAITRACQEAWCIVRIIKARRAARKMRHIVIFRA